MKSLGHVAYTSQVHVRNGCSEVREVLPNEKKLIQPNYSGTAAIILSTKYPFVSLEYVYNQRFGSIFPFLKASPCSI